MLKPISNIFLICVANFDVKRERERDRERAFKTFSLMSNQTL